MTNPFVQSLARSFEQGLHLLEAAVADCPDALWETDLWSDAPTAPAPHGGLHGSAPWFLAYHALSVLDYDLAAELDPWAGPPTPFDDNTWSSPNRVFTKAETLGFVSYCRERVRSTLAALTEERAARPVPPAHRWHGTSYAELIGGLPLHLVEHAAQIRQFVTAAGVAVRPMPGDHGFTG